MELILPELLLLGLVEKGEVSNMVNEDIAKDRQFRVDGGDLAKFRSKWGAKSLQCGGGVEFVDFAPHLESDEFALEVCIAQMGEVSECQESAEHIVQ